MRLTQEQIQKIVQTVSRLNGSTSEIFLFGSRLDDSARGGDIDLLVETDAPLTLIDRALIKLALESDLGLPIDVIAQTRNAAPTPFQIIARARASDWRRRAMIRNPGAPSSDARWQHPRPAFRISAYPDLVKLHSGYAH